MTQTNTRWFSRRGFMTAIAAFFGLAIVGGLAILLLALAMPETRPVNEARATEAVA